MKNPLLLRKSPSSIEPLESRYAPSAVSFPSVLSINRDTPPTEGTAATSVTFKVAFNEAVTGVDAADFQVFTSVNAKADALVAVATTADPTVFNVTVSGLKGNGDVRLDLVDNDSIVFSATPLGGPGVNNGSFTGQTYHLLQAGPLVNSFDAVGATSTGAASVSFTLTFSEPVTGVDPTDFTSELFDGLTGPITTTVTPVAGTNGAGYTVTATAYAGTGRFQLHLVEDGTITNAAGNTPPSGPNFSAPKTTVTGGSAVAIASGDVNGDGKPDLVLANNSYFSGSPSVSVLLGKGDGTFQSQNDFAIGNNPTSVALADVNGDGKLDIVATGTTSDSQTSANHFVSVLLGNGDGSFAPRQDFGNNSDTGTSGFRVV